MPKALQETTLTTTIICIAFALSCGQPIPPTGGPRDSLPPLLVNAVPPDSTVNFKGDRITLTFNEYIQLESPFEKLLHSPVPKVKPTAEGRLKNVYIRIKDTLEPNTTYSIDFDDAIKDINENNPLRGFTYVFSTGPRIDSGVIAGQVLLAATGKADSTLLVVLHRSGEDSAFAKERPRYTAKVNARGEFAFRYLPEGSFHIFALGETDGGLKYDQATETVAFLERPVRVNAPDPVRLLAFSTEKEAPPKPAAAPAAATPRNKDDRRLKFATNLEGGRQDLLGNLEFVFESRLQAYDSAKLLFTDDEYRPAGAYTLRLDSTRRKLTLAHAWREDARYKIILQRDFARDSSGNAILRADTVSLQTKREADYGSLNLRIRNTDTSQSPVLLLLRDERIELAQPLRTDRFRYRLFRTGEYDVRILFDRNGNGKWDTGDYWRRLQPERVVERGKKLTIRAGWENELEIDIAEVAR